MMNNEDTAELYTVKHQKKPIIPRILTAIILILLCFLAFSGYSIYGNLQPVTSESQEISFTVEEGSTLKSVTQALEDAGIIKDNRIAYYYAKLKNLTEIKAGNFILDPSWTLEKIYTTLNDSGSALTDTEMVTIVEGDWAKDIAKKFAAVTDVSEKKLLKLWNNEEWIRSKMDRYPFLTEDMFNDDVRILLEGYLAPETYNVNKETTAEEITTILLDQTMKIYEKYLPEIEKSKYSVHEIFTLASIVQYEGGNDLDTLKDIASVFINRLNIDMALQSSVTVCYVIDFEKDVDNWQACEVSYAEGSDEYNDPYNTYTHQGFPPGPIENPGENAFEAVLNPNSTDYLYFYAEVATGKIFYAKTFQEHQKNINEHPN